MRFGSGVNRTYTSDSDLFAAALEQESPTERAAFLVSTCGDDIGLRLRVERLLQAYSLSGDFLEGPLVIPPDVLIHLGT